jgi:hypothetical protein
MVNLEIYTLYMYSNSSTAVLDREYHGYNLNCCSKNFLENTNSTIKPPAYGMAYPGGPHDLCFQHG